jgi:N-acylneuraminate cytidylyltransferase
VKNLAIIPARGGSKRIPRKNVRPFCGKPIIAYPIAAALESGLFDEVMVSTDDVEIAAIARAHGAAVPFMRSAAASDDRAPLADVLVETISAYEQRGIGVENVCCILATAPFVTARELVDSHEAFARGGFDSLVPVVRFGYPIFRALRLDGGKLSMIWPEHRNARSQDLPKAYHDAGAFYWARADRVVLERSLFMSNTGSVEIPESEAQDIDTEEDWKLAELKYELGRRE